MYREPPTLDDAIALHQAGALDEAAAIYRLRLARQPDDHASLHLLGLVSHQRGDTAGAIDRIGRAIQLSPGAAHYRSNLGQALRADGRLVDAGAALLVARALRPGSAEIASNLGGTLVDLGQFDEAIRVLREAIALDPGLVDAHYNLGNALDRAGDLAAAAAAYRACLRLRPEFADAHFNLGHVLARLGSGEAAEQSYRAALSLAPDHADAHTNLGVLLRLRDRVEQAAACFAEAQRLRPGDPAAACNLGAALLAMGRGDEAAACFDRVLAREPDHGLARLGRLVAHLPVVAQDEAEIARRRAAYAEDLARLIAESERPALRASLAAAAGGFQPFFLAYHGQDDRPLNETYGRLIHRLTDAAPPAFAAPRRGARLRLGVVSGFFCEHTVWHLFLRGWLEHLDPATFRLFGYHTGAKRDGCTEAAARACERFVTGPRSPEEWRAAVLADAPDILLYPEIGMDPVAARLASQRLAAVQCAAWGHPVTSGLPSIDCFLSSQAMEPRGASAHYAERLVTLPRLGICFRPTVTHVPSQTSMRTRAAERAEFGLRPDAVVYWSGQNLPKYRPCDDEVFPRIAAAVPDCQFVFIAFGHGAEMTRRFARRLDRAFARHGLDAAAHCVVLPQLSPERFIAAASMCDVVLDTIGWSGGRSTLDLLAVDPVIVTWPGPFLRGRHTAAILETIGAPETIAASLDAYVDLAIRLGREPDRRSAVRRKVADGKARAYDDGAAIRAMAEALQAAVTRA